MEDSPNKDTEIYHKTTSTKRNSVSSALAFAKRKQIDEITTEISPEKEFKNEMKKFAKEINRSVKVGIKKSVNDELVQSVVDKINQENRKKEKEYKEEGKRKSVLDIEFIEKARKEKEEQNRKAKENLRISQSLQKNQDFYNRVKDNINKVQKKLENKKEQIDKEEKSQIKKVEVSNYSKKILNSKLKDLKPIHDRTEEILRTKKNEIELKKEVLKEKEEEHILLVTSQYITGHTFDKNKFNEWVDKKQDWVSKKNNKLKEEIIKIEKKEKEEVKNYFHPQIDKKSEQISKKICDKPAHIRLNDRENFLDKFSKKIKIEEPTFKPNLNSSLPKFDKSKKLESTSKEKNNKFHKKSRNLSADEINESYKNTKSNSIKVKKNHYSSYDNRETNLSVSENVSIKYQNKAIRLMKEIENLENTKTFKRESIDKLYKINTQNSSSCDKNKLNKVVLPRKFGYMVKTFVKTN